MDVIETRYAPPERVRLRLVLAPLVQGSTDPTAPPFHPLNTDADDPTFDDVSPGFPDEDAFFEDR